MFLTKNSSIAFLLKLYRRCVTSGLSQDSTFDSIHEAGISDVWGNTKPTVFTSPWGSRNIWLFLEDWSSLCIPELYGSTFVGIMELHFVFYFCSVSETSACARQPIQHKEMRFSLYYKKIRDTRVTEKYISLGYSFRVRSPVMEKGKSSVHYRRCSSHSIMKTYLSALSRWALQDHKSYSSAKTPEISYQQERGDERVVQVFPSLEPDRESLMLGRIRVWYVEKKGRHGAEKCCILLWDYMFS